MAVKHLLDGPVFAGTLVKFSVDSNSTLVLSNKNLSDDSFSSVVLLYRKPWSSADDIQGANDSDFVELTPQLSLTNMRNSRPITKGHYAIKIDTDGVLKLSLVYEGEEQLPDTRKQDSLDRVLTQYRESPNLLGMIVTYNKQVCLAEDAISGIPPKFDIDTAIGDQLTILGKWLGFPRQHNVPSPVPVFGFECTGYTSQYTIKGFCEGALWLGCPGVSSFEVSIDQDELYRRFLYVRRYQLLGMNDYRTFILCIQILFGSNSSYAQTGRVITVNTGRSLTDYEQQFIQVFSRVLPRALGATINIQTS